MSLGIGKSQFPEMVGVTGMNWAWHAWAQKNIYLFPICCHFNQWVGREFILFFVIFFLLFNQ